MIFQQFNITPSVEFQQQNEIVHITLIYAQICENLFSQREHREWVKNMQNMHIYSQIRLMCEIARKKRTKPRAHEKNQYIIKNSLPYIKHYESPLYQYH